MVITLPYGFQSLLLLAAGEIFLTFPFQSHGSYYREPFCSISSGTWAWLVADGASKGAAGLIRQSCAWPQCPPGVLPV